MSAGGGAGDPAGGGRRAAWVLALLTLVNLANYLDRFVVSALVESLSRSELRLGDAQLGSLMTGFILVYMLASPLFGAWADRGASRPRLLAGGIAAWSVATALSGLARSYGELFLARAAVGIGEAAYGVVAPALLADLYPRERRGRVFAIFYAAIPVGSALGYVLGGLVDRHLGWRAAFLIAGGPGLLLAAACLLLVDPPRGAHDREHDAARAAAAGPPRRGPLAAAGRLARNALYRRTVLGYAAYTAALGAMGFWMPAFLERVRGMARADATIQFGAIVVVTGFVGTFAGGFLGDALQRRSAGGWLWLSGATAAAAVPLSIASLTAAGRTPMLAALVAAQLCLFASTGPVNSAIVNAVPAADRATAVALSILAIHALGDVPSPWLVGVLSESFGLGRAVLLMPLAVAVAAAAWLLAARRADAGPGGPGGSPP